MTKLAEGLDCLIRKMNS